MVFSSSSSPQQQQWPQKILTQCFCLSITKEMKKIARPT